ncbi:MAG TPA: hypothetical protein PK357_00190 [Candidatus Pacearchaeota archaeon]|nr:hypothetical protein [Candidatus Pacearchaeota archaeon]
MRKEHYKEFNKEVDFDTPQVNSQYGKILRLMQRYSGDNSSVDSGLMLTGAFYIPKKEEIIPCLFGTLYNGKIFSEIEYSKSQIQENANLRVKSWCKNKRTLDKFVLDLGKAFS